MSDAQLNILAAHTVLVQGTPTPHTNIFDVIVPTVAVVAAFLPVLAPVSGLMASIYAVTKTVTKRENAMEDVIWAESPINCTDGLEALQKRQVQSRQLQPAPQSQQTTDTINDILKRVAKLEEVPPKTWLDQAKDLSTVVSTAGDAAA